MTTARSSTLALLVCCAVVLFAAASLVAPAVAQERDEAFKAGLEARDDRRWQDATAQMRQAIQADPKEDARKVRRGMLGRLSNEYLPYYFLGEALYNLGECVGAVEAWSASEQQGVVRIRADYLAVLQKGYAICEEKGILSPSRYAPLLGRTRQIVTEVTLLARSISSTAEKHLDLWRARADVREQYERGSGELQNAHSRLATATRTRIERDFADATASAERARNVLTVVDSQLRAELEGKTAIQVLATEIENLLREADALERALDAKKSILAGAPGLIGARQTASASIARLSTQFAAAATRTNMAALNDVRTAALNATNKLKSILDDVAKVERDGQNRRFTEVLASAEQAVILVADGFGIIEQRAAQQPAKFTQEIAAERDAVQTEAAALRRRLDSARRTQNTSGLIEVARFATDLRARLNAVIEIFGPPTLRDRGIREPLENGARLFFQGNYEQVITTLDQSRLDENMPHRLHVHLFRAAAFHAMWVQKGAKDESLRKQALDEIDRCRQLNPGFEPDSRAFGPRFIRFFQAGNTPPAAATTSSSPQP